MVPSLGLGSFVFRLSYPLMDRGHVACPSYRNQGRIEIKGGAEVMSDSWFSWGDDKGLANPGSLW